MFSPFIVLDAVSTTSAARFSRRMFWWFWFSNASLKAATSSMSTNKVLMSEIWALSHLNCDKSKPDVSIVVSSLVNYCPLLLVFRLCCKEADCLAIELFHFCRRTLLRQFQQSVEGGRNKMFASNASPVGNKPTTLPKEAGKPPAPYRPVPDTSKVRHPRSSTSPLRSRSSPRFGHPSYPP